MRVFCGLIFKNMLDFAAKIFNILFVLSKSGNIAPQTNK
jgi:hypothetical protein